MWPLLSWHSRTHWLLKHVNSVLLLKVSEERHVMWDHLKEIHKPNRNWKLWICSLMMECTYNYYNGRIGARQEHSLSLCVSWRKSQASNRNSQYALPSIGRVRRELKLTLKNAKSENPSDLYCRSQSEHSKSQSVWDPCALTGMLRRRTEKVAHGCWVPQGLRLL